MSCIWAVGAVVVALSLPALSRALRQMEYFFLGVKPDKFEVITWPAMKDVPIMEPLRVGEGDVEVQAFAG